MTARAIWKGIICFGDVAVPVKLYSAIEDRTVHFRLLHREDKSPIKQVMVNPETEKVVAYDQVQRAYKTGDGDMVMIAKDELDALTPEKSRDIRILKFLPPRVIDHRWYERPYYLGPDGDDEQYFALSQALAEGGREGLAHWVMRNKEYIGALRLFNGYPILMSLRHAEQVVSVDELEPPRGKALDKKELAMAGQLIEMLAADFDPGEYRDDYRQRVLDMIEDKRRGGGVRKASRSKRRESSDLSGALEASLKGVRHG